MPAAIPIIGLAVSAGSSIYQASRAKKDVQVRTDDMNNYPRQALINPYSQLQVSTLGADRQREDMSRIMATYANLAAMGGSRAVVGLTPQLIQQQNTQGAQIMADLDAQEKQRQALIAQGESQVQNMMENRENADLAGLGNQLNIATQQKAQATNSLIQTGVAGAQLGMDMMGEGMFDNLFAKKYKPITTGKPAGLIMPNTVFNPESLPAIPNLPPNFGARVNPFNLPYLVSKL
jgi:hypothetical protein